MVLIFRIAAGVIIGILGFSVIAHFSVERYVQQQIQQQDKGKNVIGKLPEKLTLFSHELESYKNEFGSLPKYLSDMGCKVGRETQTKYCFDYKKDDAYYIKQNENWLRIDPYIDSGKVSFHCATTIDKKYRKNSSLGKCKDLSQNEIPEFAQPSFDCKKASNVVEQLICSNDRLVASDIKLSKAYKDVLKRSLAEKIKQIKKDQINFIKKRNKTCTSASCIDDMTKNRIIELEKY